MTDRHRHILILYFNNFHVIISPLHYRIINIVTLLMYKCCAVVNLCFCEINHYILDSMIATLHDDEIMYDDVSMKNFFGLVYKLTSLYLIHTKFCIDDRRVCWYIYLIILYNLVALIFPCEKYFLLVVLFEMIF